MSKKLAAIALGVVSIFALSAQFAGIAGAQQTSNSLSDQQGPPPIGPGQAGPGQGGGFGQGPGTANRAGAQGGQRPGGLGQGGPGQGGMMGGGMMGGGGATMVDDNTHLYILQGGNLIKVRKSDLSVERQARIAGQGGPQGGGQFQRGDTPPPPPVEESDLETP